KTDFRKRRSGDGAPTPRRTHVGRQSGRFEPGEQVNVTHAQHDSQQPRRDVPRSIRTRESLGRSDPDGNARLRISKGAALLRDSARRSTRACVSLTAPSPRPDTRAVNSLWGWVGFNVVVLAILALDLGVLHRRSEKVSLKEAAIWSGVWVALSLCFAFAVYRTMGKESGLEFLTGYLIEYALSVDNIFVFVLIFSYFSVPEKYQHRVLFWGII